MPDTLKKSDPNLVEAVTRSRKSLTFWGILLLVDAIFTGIALRANYPLAPLAGIVAGALCLFSGQPIVFALVAAQLALGMLRTAFPVGLALGWDPIIYVSQAGAVTAAAVVFTRGIFFYTAAQQFLHYRLLYGSASFTGTGKDAPAIPEMIPNRANLFARWSLWAGITSVLTALAAFGLLRYDLHVAALGLSGATTVLAVGLGLGAAFSPTDRRGMALAGTLTGMLGFAAAVIIGGFILG